MFCERLKEQADFFPTGLQYSKNVFILSFENKLKLYTYIDKKLTFKTSFSLRFAEKKANMTLLNLLINLPNNEIAIINHNNQKNKIYMDVFGSDLSHKTQSLCTKNYQFGKINTLMDSFICLTDNFSYWEVLIPFYEKFYFLKDFFCIKCKNLKNKLFVKLMIEEESLSIFMYVENQIHVYQKKLPIKFSVEEIMKYLNQPDFTKLDLKLEDFEVVFKTKIVQNESGLRDVFKTQDLIYLYYENEVFVTSLKGSLRYSSIPIEFSVKIFVDAKNEVLVHDIYNIYKLIFKLNENGIEYKKIDVLKFEMENIFLDLKKIDIDEVVVLTTENLFTVKANVITEQILFSQPIKKIFTF